MQWRKQLRTTLCPLVTRPLESKQKTGKSASKSHGNKIRQSSISKIKESKKYEMQDLLLVQFNLLLSFLLIILHPFSLGLFIA